MAISARLVVPVWMLPIWSILYRRLPVTNRNLKRRNTGIYLWIAMRIGWKNGFWKAIKSGKVMFTDNVNRGWIMVYSPVPWPAIWIGGCPYRSMKRKERCSMSGSMLLSDTFLQRKIWLRNGKNIGRIPKPGWSILSGKIILYSIVLFSLRCWKQKVVIYCPIMCRPMSFWIWKETRFRLPGIGPYGCMNICVTSKANRMCCGMYWQPMLPKPKTTILPGRIFKPGITVSWWLFTATSSTAHWCWRRNISAV